MDRKEVVKGMIGELLGDIEEEDTGMSLLAAYEQEAGELAFFNPADREKVVRILNKLYLDSVRHKGMLCRVIGILAEGNL